MKKVRKFGICRDIFGNRRDWYWAKDDDNNPQGKTDEKTRAFSSRYGEWIGGSFFGNGVRFRGERDASIEIDA